MNMGRRFTQSGPAISPRALGPQPGTIICFPTAATGTIQSGSGRAYWTYLGLVREDTTINVIRFEKTAAGSGAQVAEIALASTPAAPAAVNQTLTKLWAASIAADLTAVGSAVIGQASGQLVPAGTHLWAGIRTAMAGTDPVFLAAFSQFGDGPILVVDGGGALTGAGPWTGVCPAGVFVAPAMIATLDVPPP